MAWLEELHELRTWKSMINEHDIEDYKNDGYSQPSERVNNNGWTQPEVRKAIPIATGVLDYFPLALREIAKCSKAGNDQHNPGQPLHWSKNKSTDHADSLMRHLIDRGTVDVDGVLHSAKVAWRALALLQIEMENK